MSLCADGRFCAYVCTFDIGKALKPLPMSKFFWLLLRRSHIDFLSMFNIFYLHFCHITMLLDSTHRTNKMRRD